MFILVRIHGFHSVTSDRKPDPKQKRKGKDIHWLLHLESPDSVWLPAQLKARLKQCHQSRGPHLSALLSLVCQPSFQVSFSPMVPTWLPALLGLYPCRSEFPERNISLCTRTLWRFTLIRPTQSHFLSALQISGSVEGEALISVGQATCPTPRAAVVTSEPHGLNGVGVGQISRQELTYGRMNVVRARTPLPVSQRARQQGCSGRGEARERSGV